MAVTKQFMGPTDFHGRKKTTVEVNGTINCLVINILQNIFFCAEFKFWSELSFKGVVKYDFTYKI